MKSPSLLAALLATSAVALAAGAALADPPQRVGRISDVEGDVSFQPPQEDFWTAATRNYPVTAGESFWTGDNGRVELEIGPFEARADSETELDVVDADYGQTRLALPQGSVSLKLWSDPSVPLPISTPAGDVLLRTAGFYRIDVGAPADDGSYPPVEVTVFAGDAQAPGVDGFADVGPGQAAVVYAGSDPQLQDGEDASIDDWARQRIAAEGWRARADLPMQLTGFQDLDGAGDFVADPQYGQVWFPHELPADWAPYRDGHWAYVAPWGYTWIDDQPWGFAPFHYGRWARFDGRWGWIPGRPQEHPVYAPALVAFIGGGGWSVGVNLGGGGAIGWVPLAPEEVYRPSYRVSEAYVRNVNVSNVSRTTIINSVTVNNVTVTNYRNAPAATVVRASAFSGGQSVRRAAVAVPAEALAHAPAATAAPAPAPPREVRMTAAGHAEGAAAPRAAPPPPARLQAVRAAVVAHPAGSHAPPVIAGAHVAPPQAHPPGTGAMARIAPAQLHHPEAQGRQTAVDAAPRGAPPAEPARRPAAVPPQPLAHARPAPAAAAPAEEPAASPASRERARSAPPAPAHAPARVAAPQDRQATPEPREPAAPAPPTAHARVRPTPETPAEAKARREAAAKQKHDAAEPTPQP